MTSPQYQRPIFQAFRTHRFFQLGLRGGFGSGYFCSDHDIPLQNPATKGAGPADSDRCCIFRPLTYPTLSVVKIATAPFFIYGAVRLSPPTNTVAADKIACNVILFSSFILDFLFGCQSILLKKLSKFELEQKTSLHSIPNLFVYMLKYINCDPPSMTKASRMFSTMTLSPP